MQEKGESTKTALPSRQVGKQHAPAARRMVGQIRRWSKKPNHIHHFFCAALLNLWLPRKPVALLVWWVGLDQGWETYSLWGWIQPPTGLLFCPWGTGAQLLPPPGAVAALLFPSSFHGYVLLPTFCFPPSLSHTRTYIHHGSLLLLLFPFSLSRERENKVRVPWNL